jgi:hypothetical protein
MAPDCMAVKMLRRAKVWSPFAGGRCGLLPWKAECIGHEPSRMRSAARSGPGRSSRVMPTYCSVLFSAMGHIVKDARSPLNLQLPKRLRATFAWGCGRVTHDEYDALARFRDRCTSLVLATPSSTPVASVQFFDNSRFRISVVVVLRSSRHGFRTTRRRSLSVHDQGISWFASGCLL